MIANDDAAAMLNVFHEWKLLQSDTIFYRTQIDSLKYALNINDSINVRNEYLLSIADKQIDNYKAKVDIVETTNTLLLNNNRELSRKIKTNHVKTVVLMVLSAIAGAIIF